MLQPSPDTAYIPPVIQAGDVTPNAVDKFCNLGSILANTTNSENDITARLGVIQKLRHTERAGGGMVECDTL